MIHQTTTDSDPVRVLELEPRDCENCLSDNLEPLSSVRYDAHTRVGTYRFDSTNVICRSCGFVFVSPIYRHSDLSEYYQNSFAAFEGQQPDYDSAKRISFLADVAPHCDVLVEIGSNRKTAFHDRLSERCREIRLVELNASVEGVERSLANVSARDADVVVHYFVLEHVARVREFLQDCHRILRADGVMVCEVPDLAIYPRDPSGLLFEHTNHFSVEILRQIARRNGFELIKVDPTKCSRPFGFVAAFRKVDPIEVVAKTNSQYEDNRACFLGGLAKREEQRKSLRQVADTVAAYQQQRKNILFWAANELMATYFDLYPPLDGLSIFDSNPEKCNFFGRYQVSTPDQGSNKICDADAIFLFTRLHASEVLHGIEAKFGKVFDPAHVHIVD